MRYANYQLDEYGAQYIGDYIQIIAIDELYKKMGISLDEVVYIPIGELGSYNGEYVILPVTLPLVNYVEGGICNRFSDHIIPVFLGLTMVKDFLSKEEVNYLREFEPIGCRDEYALVTCRKYGIKSFLFGCTTITFSKRICNETDIDPEKIYIVDVVSEMTEFIPEFIRQNAVYRSHLLNETGLPAKEAARYLLDDYKRNSKLVITSLLHCAIPCTAMGIPVVLLVNSISYRFGWVEKLLPIYTKDKIDLIDWNPKPLDIEKHKFRVYSTAEMMLRQSYDYYSKYLNISWFYENRMKSCYVNDAVDYAREFIEKNWVDLDAEYEYAFWGMTQISEWIHNFVMERFPKAKLIAIYDSYRKVSFKGIESKKPDNIQLLKGTEYIFVTTMNATIPAKKLFDQLNRDDSRVVYLKPLGVEYKKKD
ncbi:MAG: polysaccharide pyruvyl transferase family protein [Lachnospiraceae bacterium]|nr:polysaccharide pyruvyl transferase family protein [Lachnospiraceae bacterium]